MGTNPASRFGRAFGTRDFFRGAAFGSLVYATASSFVLLLLLADCLLLADLLVEQGQVTLSSDALEAVERRTQILLVPDETPRDPRIAFSDAGILPIVARSAGTVWSTPTAALYARVELLRSNASAMHALLLCGALLALARNVLCSRSRTFAARAGQQVAVRLRRRVHHQTLRLGPSDLENRDARHAFDLFTSSVDCLRDGLEEWIHALVRFPFELLMLTLLILMVHWLLALQCLIPLVFCWFLLHRERRRVDADRRLSDDRARSELSVLAEGLQKTRLVRGFGMDEFEQKHFNTHLERLEDNMTAFKQGQRRSVWFVRVLILAAASITALLIADKILLPETASDQLPLSATMLFVLSIACMHGPLEALWNLGKARDASGIALDRIYRYIDEIPEVGQTVGARFLQPLTRSLRFEGVTYANSGKRKLLDRFDLKIPAGSVTAFVSLDPLEALAAAYLLPRFIEPQSGRVLIDGEDVALATLESLRAETILVGGNDPFLTGSVLENISCGASNYSLQKVTEAAKAAHAHHFILKLSEGYETMLGEHGESLTPGQGFRLGLARANLRNPALLIVEEPAPPIDEDTKSMLDDAYTRLQRDRTVLFLPTRLSTARKADQIVVIHRGKVAAVGTHAELVKTSAEYRHWEYVRFNEFQRGRESENS